MAVTETVRAPHGEQVIEAYVEQNGLLVVEAEDGTATAAGSHDWVTETVQSGYEGTGYSRALPDIGAHYEETETASSPQLSWPIYNETADTYSVWVRGMAPDAGGDSLHVALDGQTPSSSADLTGFTDEWGWSRVTPAGDATVDLTSTGEHDLEAWMREDGLRVDRVLLVTDTNYIPSGFGPAESPFETITETVPGGLGTTSISYGYDALYRLTGATYSGAITATFAYEYDPVGNMTTFTETVDAQTTSVTRSFDGANRLEYAVNASGTTTYTYDANGNLVELLPPGATGADPVGSVRYDYDQRNLMVGQETNPDGAAWVLQAEYVYDGADDRLQQVDYTGATPITTTYTNDIFGLTQVLVADDGTTQVYNLFGLDLISQDGDEVRTLLVDGLGSVRLEMVGSVVETATTYSPYGEVLEQAGMSGTVYGFTGEQEDGATGLLYLRARYYSPYIYRMLTPDSIVPDFRNPQHFNLYTYSNNNPVNWVDPSGHRAQTPPGGAYSCGSLEECQWAAEQLDGGEPSGSCGSDCAWVIGPGGKRYEYSLSEAAVQFQRGQTVGEIVLSVVCEPLDWYFTLKDGFQWHDTIGLLPIVPGVVGRWGDDAYSLVGRHWDDTLSWQDNVAKAADNRVIRWGVEGSYDVAREAAQRNVPILPGLFKYNNSSSIEGYQLHHLWPEGLGGPRDGWAVYVQFRPENYHTLRGGIQPWVDKALRDRTGLKLDEMREWARENPDELIPMLREIYFEIGIDFPY